MRSVIANPKTVQYSESELYDGNPVPQEYKGLSSYTPNSWVRSDITKVVKVDGWRKPTAYRSERTESQPIGLSAEWKTPWSLVKWNDNIVPSLWPMPGLPKNDASLRSVLIYRALAKVKDEKVNLAVTLAEIGDTVNMIARHFVKVRQAYDAAKRGKWKRAYDILGIGRNYKAGRRDLASGWLEIIYGWLPLLSDIHGAVDEINRKALSEGITIVGRAVSKTDNHATVSRPEFYRWGFISGTGFRTEWEVSHTQKVALWYRLDMPGLQRAAAIGVLNPASFLWELTPFSFLADWVGTIGDWLSSLDATVGLTYMGGTHTYHARMVSAEQTMGFHSHSGGSLKKGKITPGFHSVETMDRAVITDSPEDKFVFTNPLSASHAITASALLITSLKR